jgi:hypothetical protein
MRQLPALFSTHMVQAIQENRKTMTRRTKGLEKVNECPDEWIVERSLLDAFVSFITFQNKTRPDIITCFSSYKKGDQIYVRERFETDTDGTVKFYAGNIEVENNTAYRELTKWKPSIHMPKSAARIWLEVTRVRCERLQSISSNDCISEGILPLKNSATFDSHTQKYFDYSKPKQHFPEGLDPFWSFNSLWCSINGAESWDANPWVFIYEFKRIEKP